MLTPSYRTAGSLLYLPRLFTVVLSTIGPHVFLQILFLGILELLSNCLIVVQASQSYVRVGLKLYFDLSSKQLICLTDFSLLLKTAGKNHVRAMGYLYLCGLQLSILLFFFFYN